MIGDERAIQLGPLDLEHRLIWETEPLEHRDGRRVLRVDRELDVGEHEAVVALPDQDRSAYAVDLGVEAMAVH